MQTHLEKHGRQLHERQLLNIVDDLCRFILHEVVNMEDKFFDETSELNSDTVKRPRGMMEKHA